MFTNLQSIKGSMGGGGHTPVEAPDSGVSQQKAQLLIVISEGEISQLLDSEIYLNKVKATEYNSVTIDSRLGTSDQTYISGFEDINSPNTTPSAEIRHGNVVIDGVTEASVSPIVTIVASSDAVSLLFTINSLYKVEDNGDTNGSSVSISIYSRKDSDAWSGTPIKTITVTEKISSPYGFSTEIPRPVPAINIQTHWQVKIVKTTSDSDTQKLANNIFFTQAIDIVFKKLKYPYKALLGLTATDAKQFGGKIPEILCKPDGIKVFVPFNYNTTTRIYTGTWYGNFTPAKHYTNNPAWCLFHVLTDNDIFNSQGVKVKESIGLKMSTPLPTGRTYPIPDDFMDIDIFAFYQLGKYCDELVNGNIRYTVDYQFIQRENVTTFLNYFLNLMEARFKRNEFGQLSLFWDRRGQDVVRLVTNQNVEDGLFTYSASNLEQRFTVVNVTYNDETAFGESNTVTVTTSELNDVKLTKNGIPLWYDEDNLVYKELRWNGSAIEQTATIANPFDLVNRYGLNSTDIVLLGATTEERATRKGRTALYNSCFLYDIVGFKVLLAGMNYQLGDLIAVADNNVMRNNAIRSGKFIAVARATLSVTVTFDRPVELTNGITYDLSYTCIDGVTIAITNVTGASTITSYTFTITSSAEEPLLISVWILKKTTVEPELFKVVGIQLDSDTGAYVISCMRHLEAKYDYIETTYVTNTQQGDFSNLKYTTIEPVKDIGFRNSFVYANESLKPAIQVYWTYPSWEVMQTTLGRLVTTDVVTKVVYFSSGLNTLLVRAGTEIKDNLGRKLGILSEDVSLISNISSTGLFYENALYTVTGNAATYTDGASRFLQSNTLDNRIIKFDVIVRKDKETPKTFTVTSPSYNIIDAVKGSTYYVNVVAFDSLNGVRSAMYPPAATPESWTLDKLHSSPLNAPTSLKILETGTTSSKKDTWTVTWTAPTLTNILLLIIGSSSVTVDKYLVDIRNEANDTSLFTFYTTKTNFVYNRSLFYDNEISIPLPRVVNISVKTVDTSGQLSSLAEVQEFTKTEPDVPSFTKTDTGSGINIKITYKANQGIMLYKVYAKNTAFSANPTDDTNFVKTIPVSSSTVNNQVLNSIVPYPSGHTAGGTVYLIVEAVDGFE